MTQPEVHSEEGFACAAAAALLCATERHTLKQLLGSKV